MTRDLWMLVASAGLQWALIMLPATEAMLRNGLLWAVGNRDAAPQEPPAWSERAKRASANLQENLILFAILVIVVAAAGKANSTSALGAVIFFAARCAHAVFYLAGIIWVRTLSWAVSITGMFLIVSTLL